MTPKEAKEKVLAIHPYAQLEKFHILGECFVVAVPYGTGYQGSQWISRLYYDADTAWMDAAERLEETR